MKMFTVEILNLFLITWALYAGLLTTRIGNIFRLPDITSYLVVGVLIGPSVLGRLGVRGIGFVSFEEVERLSILSDVALGFIAFSIGSEFKMKNLKTIGRQATIIGILQAVITSICVDIVFIALHFIMPDVISMQVALTLGAIAAATAPAATLLVVKQYKAMGSVTDVLLPVVALDDAVGLMIFAISFGIAQTLNTGTLSVFTLIIEPILSIILSLFLGTVAAVFLNNIESLFKSYSNRLVLVIGTVILSIAIAKITFSTDLFSVSFSPLLVCMMLGTVFCNICPDSDELMQLADRWANPILVLFFVLSGAELNLDVFKDRTIIMIGIIYILVRCLGKYYGARISATIAGSPSEVRKYLGITLFPQAGVALGMSAIAATSLGADGLLIRNITLFGVLIYELFGPVLTKNALIKSGDIKEITPS